jgi:two-component system, chemotaxis family, sensor kinase CheA
VDSYREYVDELVVLCLGGAIDEPQALAQAGRLLFELERQPRLQGCEEELSKLRAVRAKIEQLLASGKAPTRRSSNQLTEQLEELSHVLYSVATRTEESPKEPAARTKDTEFHLPPEVDEPLFNEFVSNTRLALDDLEREIEQLRTESPDALLVVKRRLHSLKGEAGMLGLADLEHILHCSETFLEQPTPAWDRADRMLLVRDWVSDALEAYANHQFPSILPERVEQLLKVRSLVPPNARPSKPVPADAPVPASDSPADFAAAPPSAAQTFSLSEAPRSPAPEVANGATIKQAVKEAAIEPNVAETFSTQSCPWSLEDDELVVEFLSEIDEHLSAVDQVLIDAEQTGIDAERINRLFRAFHTLKGVASFLRLQQFIDLTHATETMLDRIRSGESIPIACAIDLVFDATTLLRKLAQFIQECLTQRSDLKLHDGVVPLLLRLKEATEGNLEHCHQSIPNALPGEKLGEILVRQGVIDDATVQEVLDAQKLSGNRVGQELVNVANVPAKTVAHALRAQRTSNETTAKMKEVVKVDLERVDMLVEAIGELVIVESMVSNAPEIRQLPPHLRNYLGQFAKITRELQELGMFMRMVPVRAEFQKMARMTRDLARRSNKVVRMEFTGEGTEMDRVMVEQLADPLVHLIRNAVDHGIEPAEDRRAAGKPEAGLVRLSACHEGGNIIIEISDDGRGINRERVLAKAIAQGIIDKNASLSETQIFDLIFAPGFSTAQQVTEISGRGVGMDVVKRNIEAVRGRILTTSVPGKGTTFRLVLPLTLAIIDGMVIRCGDERFILPTLNIIESLQPTLDMLFSFAGAQEHILVRNQTLPLIRLNRLLDVRDGEDDPTKALVIIIESLRSQVALLVDEVVMKQQVVIKTLNHELDSSRIFAGAAILSNGRVGLIINVESLIDVSRESPAIPVQRASIGGASNTTSFN